MTRRAPSRVCGRVVEHLYFHIPFCPKLCPYCSFYVEVGSEHKTAPFLDALLDEVTRATDTHEIRPRTIYFGGGTPSALTVAQLRHLCEGVRARLDLRDLEEWDLEANPATIREEKAHVLRELGVTRLSLGVQSWDDALLRTLGRAHDAAQAERTFHLLRAAGFQNVNIDLMFSAPGQTPEQWEATLEKTIRLKPEHVSCYCLTYEEDTEYLRKLAAGEFVQDIHLDALLFETTMQRLPAAGLVQYEISNYAQPGRESRHNLAYWRGRDYLGFGPSAVSTVGLQRWRNAPDVAVYTARARDGERPVRTVEELTPGIRRSEAAAFGMRMAEGLASSDLAPWREELVDLYALGFLHDRNGRTVLTERGKMMADSVAEIFV